MEHTGNVDWLDDAFIWKDNAGLTTLELGRSAGSQRLYANVDIVPAGAYSTKYHSHTQQEEFFYILSGEGTLRTNEGENQVKTGDFFAKPAGEGIAHTFYNSGTEPLRILDVGTQDAEDTCYYPDEKMYLHKMNGTRQIYSETALDSEWQPAPNPEKG